MSGDYVANQWVESLNNIIIGCNNAVNSRESLCYLKLLGHGSFYYSLVCLQNVVPIDPSLERLLVVVADNFGL
jgi:hypothetical protein